MFRRGASFSAVAKRKTRQARRGAEAPPPAPEAPPSAEPEATAGAGEPESGAKAGASRTKLAAVGGALVILVVAVLGAVVLASGDDSGELEYLDGVIVASEEDRLVLRLPEPVEGHEGQIEMTIPPESAADVDIEHLDYHQVQGDVFRIFFERDGDSYVARRAEDIPGGQH